MKNIFLILLVLILGFGVFGQNSSNSSTNSNSSVNQKNSEQIRISQPVDTSIKRITRIQDDDDESYQGFYLLPEYRLTKEQKQQTTLSKDVLAKYGDFLKLPKAGIFKILPNLCGDSRVVDVRNEKCYASEVPSIAFYSFRRKIYDFQDWADLRYQDKQFAVGLKSTIIGLISEVESSLFDSLNENSDEVKALLEIEMPKKDIDISSKKKDVEDGITAGNLKFIDKAEVSLNKTYLMRSYAYRLKDGAVNDRRVDIIIVFKVIDIDKDEGLTIIWKELYQGKSNLI